MANRARWFVPSSRITSVTSATSTPGKRAARAADIHPGVTSSQPRGIATGRCSVTGLLCADDKCGGGRVTQTPEPTHDRVRVGATRRYDSPLRRERAAQTRDSIISAGAELVHEFSSWDWRKLTIRAVAERAGVHERTVYRH